MTEALVTSDVEKVWSYLSTESRRSIIEEILLQDLDLAPAILDTVMESYIKDIGPRSKSRALHRVIAKLVEHIEATHVLPEEYVNQYILRCAALQLRSTMDWHIGLRPQVQYIHQKSNPNPLLDDRQVAQLYIDSAITSYDRLETLWDQINDFREMGLSEEEIQESVEERHFENWQELELTLMNRTKEGMKGFTQALISLGELPEDADYRRAFKFAADAWFTNGDYASRENLQLEP